MNKKNIYKKRLAMLKQDITKKYTNQNFLNARLKDDYTAQIDVILNDDFPIFDTLAPKKYGMLNPSIYQYIDEQIYFIPSEYDVTINFVGKTLSPLERQQIEKAIQEHYNLQVYDKVDDIKRNRWLGIFLLIFGIIALGLYFFMTISNHNLIVLEIISIVGTFSIWEAVDCWLIQGHERRVSLHNALQMAHLKITFDEANETK